MKILIVHNYYQDPGGEDIVFNQEKEALSKFHGVETLTFQNKKGLKGLLQYFLYPYNILAGNKLKKKIKSFKPDCIHVHNIHYASGPIVFRIAKKLGVPTVFTLHNYRLLCPSALLLYKGKMYTESVGQTFPWDAVKKGVLDNSIPKTFLTAFTYRFHVLLGTWKHVGAFLPLTQYAKNLLEHGNLGIHSSQIIVKPNFIEPLNADSQLENTLPYYLYIGRLSEEKGILPLLKTFNETPNLPLKIIGDGPYRNEVNKSGSNIEFLGHKTREEIAPLIKAAKAVIIPSICLEGFPMALLEAFSLKCPVIISDIVAASEVIADQKNGFKINPYEFKDTVEKLYTEDISSQGKNGFNTFEESYTKEKVIQQLLIIYKKISASVKK